MAGPINRLDRSPGTQVWAQVGIENACNGWIVLRIPVGAWRGLDQCVSNNQGNRQVALFGKKGGGKQRGGEAGGTVPTLPRSTYCRICAAERKATKCWRRTQQQNECECCSLRFENPEALYQRTQPSCPQCGEFLEQPGFEYGVCDDCGSKYELVDGTPPGLLPNLEQRKEMNKRGRIREVR